MNVAAMLTVTIVIMPNDGSARYVPMGPDMRRYVNFLANAFDFWTKLGDFAVCG
jgi:hypothetical protein